MHQSFSLSQAALLHILHCSYALQNGCAFRAKLRQRIIKRLAIRELVTELLAVG